MDEKQSVYPVGFWNYTHSGVLEVKSAVADWQQLGMTIAMSSEYEKPEDKQYILDTLDEAQKRGPEVVLFRGLFYVKLVRKIERQYNRKNCL